MRRYSIIAAFALALASCATPEAQMKKEVKDLVIKSDPEVLVVINNKIEADVTIAFPQAYFDQSTMMVITPVLVYGEKQRTGKPFLYQGEKIMANYKVVPVNGITHREHISFDFLPGMEQCRLELRCVIIRADKKTEIPAIKVADGCNATYRLVQVSGEYEYKEDGYQRVTQVSTETSVMFDVNSSTVKNSGVNRNAVSVYKSYLSDMNADERYKVTGTQIVAYASPEGGEEYNAELSDKRASAAVGTWQEMSSGMSADSLSVLSVGQDWEGFKEALENSDLEEKDLILRVLSMYSDPAVREAEIKNLSFIYEDLKTEVFPSLRRATFVVNAEHTGYSDEELLELAEKHLGMLSETEVLRLASIEEDLALKEYYYRYAAQRYLSDVGNYNLAMMALDRNSNDIAQVYLQQAVEDADVLNAKGVIELRKGNNEEARKYFLRSGSGDAKKNLGTLLILEGRYAEAAQMLEGSGSANETLAYILDGQIEKAVATAKCDSPRDAYIAAVAHARLGDAEGVKSALAVACQDEEWAEKAQKDVEFVDFR